MDHINVLKLLQEYYPKSVPVGYISYKTDLHPNRVYEILENLKRLGISIDISEDGEEQVKLLK